jgi:sugar phosphate isomerase/epimerase
MVQIGAMNYPLNDLIEEIRFFGRNDFDFIDLTLEPPEAYSAAIEVSKVKKALDEYGLDIVGHTAYYLPFASPFPELREWAIKESERCLEIFHQLGTQKMNLHPFTRVSLHRREWIIERNIEAFKRVNERAKELGIKLMVENMPKIAHDVEDLKPIFDSIPDLGFHLDVGHANLNTKYNITSELLEHFGYILEHVHISDNKGGEDDLHLPLGAGMIDWTKIVEELKNFGYDGTITLEIFSQDREYLLISRDKFRRLWESVK